MLHPKLNLQRDLQEIQARHLRQLDNQRNLSPNIVNVVGVDFGQANDYAAAVVAKRDLHQARGQITVMKIHRWDRGTSYTTVGKEVASWPCDVILPDYCGVGMGCVDILREKLMDRERELADRHEKVLKDWTARQEAIHGKDAINLVTEAPPSYRVKMPRIVPILTKGSLPGARSTKRAVGDGEVFAVPKVELVGSIERAKDAGRLRFARHPGQRSLRWEDELMGEMANFQMRHSSAGNPQFGNKPGADLHDDLVSALGLVLWYMLNFSRGNAAIMV